MKKLFNEYGMVITSGIVGLAMALTVARCGSSSSSATAYRQIERLGRPAINEALVLSPLNLFTFNSVGPDVDLTAAAADVRNDVVTVLYALYGGVCYLKGAVAGAAGLSPLVACPSTGTAIFGADGKITSNSTFMTAANSYAGKVAGHFLPDVLRINTLVTSSYLTNTDQLCNGGADGSPLLCGGRYLTDDTVDITFAYLFHGQQVFDFLTGVSLVSPFIAAIADGVNYTAGVGPLGNGDSTGNTQQGHPTVAATFPFTPAPF